MISISLTSDRMSGGFHPASGNLANRSDNVRACLTDTLRLEINRY